MNWIGDLNWTGPSTFVALGERAVLGAHCVVCPQVDSIFYGEMLLSGTITASGATLAAIPGTAGATSYAIAESGASIVFTRRDSTNLMKVSATGGVPTVIAVTPRTGVQLFGVSCRAATCVVALGPVSLWNGPANTYATIGGGAFEVRSVSLTAGQATTILTRNGVILAGPLITSTGDLIAQVGGPFGHLQTYAGPPSDLYVYKGLVP